MRMLYRSAAVILSSFLLIGTVPAVSAETGNTDAALRRVVGYLPDWNYKAYSDISALTNINIAFCNPDSSGRISCSIPDKDLRQIVSDAHDNGTEVFAALGGGGGCDGYLQHINSGEKIARFYGSCYYFVSSRNFK